VRENLALFATLYGASHDGIEHLSDELQLEEVMTTPVGDLSAGTKRRVSVARALVHGPQLLLLDEPYANLDDEASQLVSSAIQSWAGNGGIGLVASHGAKKVKAYASAGVVLQRGGVSAHGTYGERFERA
jgi:ABC-type multidrug transport system ATPase subunit